MTTTEIDKFYRRNGQPSVCGITKTAFRNYRKLNPHLSYMDVFRMFST